MRTACPVTDGSSRSGTSSWKYEGGKTLCRSPLRRPCPRRSMKSRACAR